LRQKSHTIETRQDKLSYDKRLKVLSQLGRGESEMIGNTTGRRLKRGADADKWRFKGCPKCGGDLFVDYDLNGWYEECLQCGYLHDLNTILEVREEKPATAVKKPELALAGQHRKAMRNN
jgi:hypothetical protein